MAAPGIASPVTWFDRAQRVTPGGVHSPVRAFKAMGIAPLAIVEAHGPYVTDNRRPPLHRLDRRLGTGAARSRPSRHRRRGRGRCAPRAAVRVGVSARSRAGRAAHRARSRRRDGSLRRHRHGSDDERRESRARGHATSHDHQVRGRVPRPCGHVSRQRRIRRGHVRCAGFARRDARRRRRHGHCTVQRSRQRRSHFRGRARHASPPSSSSPSSGTWAACRRNRDSSKGFASDAHVTAPC